MNRLFTVIGVVILVFANIAFAETMSFKDSQYQLQDNADLTKKAKFELSGLPTATTRTYTVPNGNLDLVGDISGIVTGSSGALTNGKGISSVSRTGTGVYVVTLSIAQANANYKVFVTCNDPVYSLFRISSPSTTQFTVNSADTTKAPAAVDSNFMFTVIP